MGRKKIAMTYLEDDRTRKISFKKRRFGILKKVMQLTALSDCHIELRIYNEEDSSLMDYFSNNKQNNYYTG